MVRVLVISSDGGPGPLESGLRGQGLAVHTAEHEVPLAWIEGVNPDCLVSVGEVPSSSVLWELPLWRRRQWLNLPDQHVGPFVVRQSLLSLMTANIESGVHRDTPALTVWSGRSTSHDLARALSEARETYDNWHIDARNERGHSGFLTAIAFAREGLIWPVDESFIGTEIGTMRLLVDAWLDSGRSGSVVVADSTDRSAILESLIDEGPCLVRHLLLDRSHFQRTPGAAPLLPFTGIVGAVAHVLASPTTQIVDHIPGASLSGDMLYNHRDSVEANLAQGPVQWSQWLNSSHQREAEVSHDIPWRSRHGNQSNHQSN